MVRQYKLGSITFVLNARRKAAERACKLAVALPRQKRLGAVLLSLKPIFVSLIADQSSCSMTFVKWDGQSLPPALKAHGLLLALMLAPTVVHIPYR